MHSMKFKLTAMKNFLIIFAIVLISSCKKSDEPVEMNEPPILPDVPSCIAEIIDDPILSASLKTVRVQELDNELHYWLNTDFVEVDGEEFIVNAQCDTLCFYCGFCVPPDCTSDYTIDDWETIWEK